MLLKDRVAVVTAGGSGMGRASALRMAREGARVVVADVNEQAAKSVVDEIEAANGHGMAYGVDVRDNEQMRGLFRVVGEEYGSLHVLYNHAGIPGEPGVDMSEEDFYLSIDVNMKSAFYGTSFALPLLRKNPGKASVIFTASVTALVASPRSPLYSMTKAGVVGYMKAMAVGLAPDIRVNAILPGPVQTPMLAQFFGANPTELPEETTRKFVDSSIPLKRTCEPEEIANVAAFLASDQASFITGVALPVDGGFLAR